MSEAASAPASAPAAANEAPGGAPAAVVAPVVPASLTLPEDSAPVVEAPAADSGDVSPVAYEKTGDPGLDFALDFVGQRGFSDEHPAMKAASNGDFTLLEAALGAMGEKARGYENVLALAKKSYADSKTKAESKVQADLDLVHNAVGGAENWKAIQEWAVKAAEPEEKASVNAALKQGGLVAKVMAQWLASQYSRASGTVITPKAAVDASAAGKPDPAAPLTARDFAKETQALRNKLGPNFEKSSDYRLLLSRRETARRAGR